MEKLNKSDLIKAERVNIIEEPKTRKVKVVDEEISNLDMKLKQELIAFRKKYLDPICDDIQLNMLSDEMINEFIRVKPTNKNEFHKISEKYRSNIASGQSQYLENIYEIVEEYLV